MIDLIFYPYSSNSVTGTHGADWEYSKSALPQFPEPSLSLPSETHITLDKPELQTEFYQEAHYELAGSVRPYLPPKVTKILKKWATRPINDKEALKVMNDIAKIAIDFYNVHEAKYIAVSFDGRIVESADSSFDLLMKIQGRQSPIKTFVWHVGSDVIAGWAI